MALATSFYDALRANGAPFFNYPQHYALLSTAHEYGTMDTKDLGAPWSALDVWPESQWIEVEANVSSMLSAACALHLSRLFWPEGFMPGKIAAPRPGYELKLLKNRLRSVWLYGSANPDIVVTGTEAVDKLVTQSITALPDKPRVATIEGHRRCAVDEFLAGMDGCFAS